MLRLEVVLYLLSSLVLAWVGGWFFVNGNVLSLVLDCAAWSALTVWILVRSVRSGLRAGLHRGQAEPRRLRLSRSGGSFDRPEQRIDDAHVPDRILQPLRAEASRRCGSVCSNIPPAADTDRPSAP